MAASPFAMSPLGVAPGMVPGGMIPGAGVGLGSAPSVGMQPIGTAKPNVAAQPKAGAKSDVLYIFYSFTRLTIFYETCYYFIFFKDPFAGLGFD